MPVTFPNESIAYRTARSALLDAELSLRAQIAEVAALRQTLPDGGIVPTDYVFTESNGQKTPMSHFFTKPRNTLVLYSLMFRPDAAAPCPMCTSMLDGLAGQVQHFGQLIDFAVVSAALPAQLAALTKARNWNGLRLLSADGTNYQTDYHAEAPDGAQLPMLNVFRKTDAGIVHFWGSEGFFAELDGHPRHVDQLWPLWNLLDLTPNGRGTDWFPALRY